MKHLGFMNSCTERAQCTRPLEKDFLLYDQRQDSVDDRTT